MKNYLVIACLLLSGCSTIVSNRDFSIDETVKYQDTTKTVTIRFYELNEKNNLREEKQTVLRKKFEEEIVLEVFKRSMRFKDVKLISFKSGSYGFTHDQDKRIEKLLRRNADKVKSDRLVDIVEMTSWHESEQVYDFLSGLTVVACIVSIGILPAIFKVDRTYKVIIRDKNYQALHEFTVDNDAIRWVWAPLLLHPRVVSDNIKYPPTTTIITQ